MPLLESSSIIVSIELENFTDRVFHTTKARIISFNAYFAVSCQIMLLSRQEDQLFNIMSGF